MDKFGILKEKKNKKEATKNLLSNVLMLFVR